VWASLAHIHGIPGIPAWAPWFLGQLEKRKALVPVLGIGCNPVLAKGDKQQFLSWLSDGLWLGEIHFPEEGGSIQWPGLDLAQALCLGEDCGRTRTLVAPNKGHRSF